MSRQSIVAPIGLITQPNQYGQYKRGALSTATNVVMRSPGVISSMPGLRTHSAATGSTTNRVIRHMMVSDFYVLQYCENAAATASEISWVNFGLVVPTTYPASWDPTATAACARFERARDRYFFASYNSAIGSTSFKSVLAFDSEASGTARPAGLSPVALLQLNPGTTTDAQAILPDSAAAWQALVRRTATTDGYELVSAPSNVANGYSAATTVDANVKVYFPLFHNYRAGDVCELYRTVSVAGATTEPGATMYLAVSQVITSTDLFNGYIIIRDNCPDASLGSALYTNSGEGGATSANLDPPASSDMCAFKGHMFYAATMTPAQAQVSPRIAYGFLSTNYERLYGIGYRQVTGDFTSGSPIVTNVSNMRGIVVGVLVTNGAIPGGQAYVSSVTATTFTLPANATATAAGSIVSVYDVMLVKQPAVSSTEYAVTLPDTIPSYMGTAGSAFVWSTTVPQTYGVETGGVYGTPKYGVEMIMRAPRVFGSAMTLRASNGINYSPPLPAANATANSYSPETRHNRYAWSKFQQPEHVPPLNFGFVGSGKLLRMVPTRDALWMFCTDGLYRLSGDGGDGADAWRLDPVDPQLVLAGRNAACALKDTVWCYTNRGLVAVSAEGGIQEISNGVVGDLIGDSSFSDTWDIWMGADVRHAEVWLTFRFNTVGAGFSRTFIFNTLTKTFVTFSEGSEYSAGVYSQFLLSMVLGKVTAGSPPGNPSQLYFELDTSNTRMPFADVRYQPLHASDPFMLKQFQSVTMLFNGMNASNVLTPNFGGTDYTNTSVNLSSGESRCTIGVPRNAPAIAGSLRPGFFISGVAAPWSFRGLSVKFTPGGEETERD